MSGPNKVIFLKKSVTYPQTSSPELAFRLDIQNKHCLQVICWMWNIFGRGIFKKEMNRWKWMHWNESTHLMKMNMIYHICWHIIYNTKGWKCWRWLHIYNMLELEFMMAMNLWQWINVDPGDECIKHVIAWEIYYQVYDGN